MSLSYCIPQALARRIPALRQLPCSHFSSSASSFASPSSSTATAKNPNKGKAKVASSCPAGKTLSGLAILKNESDPVAKPDEDYPAWLWTILRDDKVSDLANATRQVIRAGQEFDFTREKQRLRAVNKAAIKSRNFLKTT